MAFDPRKRSSKSKANWSDLSLDVLVSIANLMVLLEDFLSFGLVCKGWRSAAAKENFTGGLTHQVPLMLLYPKDDYTTTLTNSVSEFYNLRKGKTSKHSLAEVKRNEVNSSSLGWLITVTKDFGANLLHPLNHHPMVKLPNFKIDQNYGDDNHLRRGMMLNKFALSSSPSTASDYVVMAIYSCWKRLAFCRPGDHEWTIVVDDQLIPHQNYTYCDVFCYKERFRIADSRGRILVCQIEDSGQARIRVIIDQSVPLKHGYSLVCNHLLESRGVLLAVQHARGPIAIDSRICSNERRSPVHEFRVFEVPFSKGNWSDLELTNLGSRTLFLGRRCSFCIETSICSGSETNCIYDISHSSRQADGRGLGVFTMAGNMIKTYMGEYSDSHVPHLWIQPSL